VAQFFTDKELPLDKLPYQINRLLPNDVRVHHATRTAPDFNVSFSAAGKTCGGVVGVVGAGGVGVGAAGAWAPGACCKDVPAGQGRCARARCAAAAAAAAGTTT
jgi:hypothetical protein